MNRKILETITNRVEARAAAKDAPGLRAIIAAAENGLQSARDALADLDAIPAPKAVTSKPRTAESTADLDARREESQQERYEHKILADMEKADTSKLYRAIMAQGGIRPSTPDLKEEYRNVPPSYRRAHGMPGDQMADYLATYLPELGIQSENDLLAYFTERSTRARNARAA